MKTFSTSGTGNQQTLSEIESDKIPIYDSLTDVEADLANLEEGQIGATKDTGSELSAPVDTVQSGNMHAVTSNAVSERCVKTTTINGTTTDGGGTYTVKKSGNIVTLDVKGMVVAQNAGTTEVCTLPEGFIPEKSMQIVGFSGGGSADNTNMLWFTIRGNDDQGSKGKVRLYPYVALQNTSPQLHAVWIVD